jgi:hypothetical protein
MPPGAKTKHRIPFQNMPPGAWVNLALVGMALFYILQVSVDAAHNKICQNLAVDYCAYWSAGQIANDHGYAGMYDQTLLSDYQAPIYPSADDPATPERTIPFPYFPVYVLPFQLFALLNLESGFILYTLLNLAVFILYLRFFFKDLTGQPIPLRLLLMCMLCTPVFLNLFWGQANILLSICMGEFVRAHLKSNPFPAGLWLGALLLKPLLLILILPALLIQKSFKTLIGFLVMLTGILLVSYAMIGSNGFVKLMEILLASSQGGSASNPAIMMNWRMLGLNLAGVSSVTLGWIVAITGMLCTASAAWFVVRRSFLPDRVKTAVALIGMLVATGALAWHAHFPQAAVLLPLFVYLSHQSRSAGRLFLVWTFIPIVLTLTTSILVLAARQSQMTMTAVILQTGISGLILNLAILAWAVYMLTGERLTHLADVDISASPR